MNETASEPRVAYLTGEYPAVSHTFILREVEALRAHGIDVETCSIRRTGPEHHRGAAEKRAAQTTFYVLAAARNPFLLLAAQLGGLRHPKQYFSALALAWKTCPPGARAMLYQMFYFLEGTVLAYHLRASGVTHVHNHFAAASATVAMLAARIAGIQFSFTLHGPADLAEPKHWRLGTKIAEARFVACISFYARSQGMLQSDPAHWHKLRIIHCGVTPERYASAPLGRPAGQNLIFVGRLAGVKGLPVLLDALKIALKSVPDLHLTVVGDGPERQDIEALAAPLGRSVRFTGYQSQDEVAELLAASDALVLPSFAEGVPVVLMEAMASGKPVIATRITGVPELVADGVSGYLVTPGNARDLAEKILTFSTSDAATRQQMGTAGQEHVRAEFDIRQEAARLAGLFRDTAGDDIRPSP